VSEERTGEGSKATELPAAGLLVREPMEETLAEEEDAVPLAVRLQ
jgi:hypothetical protein